jgi:hypothetical protein
MESGSDRMSTYSKMEASAGFEPAVEVLQIAVCSSPEFAEVHCVLNFNMDRTPAFILVRQSSAALPLPSTHAVNQYPRSDAGERISPKDAVGLRRV